MTDILKFPDSILTTPTQDFDFDNPPMDPNELALTLIKKVNEHNGLGLSANQIGIPYRVFVIKGNPNIVCFNPKIVSHGEDETFMVEGCLSYPNLLIKIRRPVEIRTRFQVPSGAITTKPFVGLTSRVFQHELDHLDGIAFYSRANLYHRDQAFRKLKNDTRRSKQA